MTLDELRQQLDQLDGDLLALIARRQATVAVAAAKRATGRATRDYKREREVTSACSRAETLGVSGDLAGT
jgi:chorismate mutase